VSEALPATEVVIKPRTCAEAEGTLRYWVRSNTVLNRRYLVDLAMFNGNGLCACKHSQIRCQKLLKRGISPQEAVEKGLINLKEGHKVYDALRCDHILEARSAFLDELLPRMVALEKQRQGNTHVA